MSHGANLTIIKPMSQPNATGRRILRLGGETARWLAGAMLLQG
jgi:hypothetical protein